MKRLDRERASTGGVDVKSLDKGLKGTWKWLKAHE